MTQEIKVGDKVRLKKEFYKCFDFLSYSRDSRKAIAKHSGNIYTVYCINSFSCLSGRNNHVCMDVPISLLEKVEVPAEVREVKRRARIGEYIKITRARTFYEEGVICKAVVIREYPFCSSFLINRYGREDMEYVSEHDYVVLENYTPPFSLRKWKEEEINEAKKIICEIICNSNISRCIKYLPLYACKNFSDICVYCGSKMYSSKCYPTDEPNYWIGTMVALCKATKTKLPEWVRK